MAKCKVPGVKHHETKSLPHFQQGGKVSATAMGRAAKGQRDQSEANKRMIGALQTGDSVRHGVDGGGVAPAQYGNLTRSSGAPARALDGPAALRIKAYGSYKPISDADTAIAADRKQAKEGRR